MYRHLCTDRRKDTEKYTRRQHRSHARVSPLAQRCEKARQGSQDGCHSPAPPPIRPGRQAGRHERAHEHTRPPPTHPHTKIKREIYGETEEQNIDIYTSTFAHTHANKGKRRGDGAPRSSPVWCTQRAHSSCIAQTAGNITRLHTSTVPPPPFFAPPFVFLFYFGSLRPSARYRKA